MSGRAVLTNAASGGKLLMLFKSRCGGTVDTRDLKSLAGDSVPVRVRSPAPRRSKLCIACSDFFQKSERAHAAAENALTLESASGIITSCKAAQTPWQKGAIHDSDEISMAYQVFTELYKQRKQPGQNLELRTKSFRINRVLPRTKKAGGKCPQLYR